MKAILFIFFLLTVAVSATSQDTNSNNLSVTTDSEPALALFNEGRKAMDDALPQVANEKFTKASQLDPDFIMPQVMMAIGNLYTNDLEKFKLHANKALKSRATLTDSEKLIQQAMKELIEDPKADVTNYGKKLVDMHPKSMLAYELLANFQNLSKDYEGALKTYQSMLSITRNQAPVYNMLGYTYMELGQMDKAKESFEKYLELAPNNANAYDSMGDYYAKAKDFENAQQSYLKAYEMDSTHFMISQQKAEKIKEQVAEK